MKTLDQTFIHNDNEGINNSQIVRPVEEVRLTYYSPNLLEIELGCRFIQFRVAGPIPHSVMNQFLMELIQIGVPYHYMGDFLPEIYKLFKKFGFVLYAK